MWLNVGTLFRSLNFFLDKPLAVASAPSGSASVFMWRAVIRHSTSTVLHPYGLPGTTVLAEHMTVPRFCPPALPVWPGWPLKSSGRPPPPTGAFLLSIVVSKSLAGTLAHSTDPKHEGPILFLFLIYYLGLFNPRRETETKVTVSKSWSRYFWNRHLFCHMSTVLKKPVMQMLKKTDGSFLYMCC